MYQLNKLTQKHIEHAKPAKKVFTLADGGGLTEDGQFELATPRDRAGSFEPQLVKKHQRRFTSMDE